MLHVSLPEHVPSPQVLHEPQSVEQVEQVSLPLQLPSPQLTHEPQSVEHVEQVSLPLQLPSPQDVHAPQSLGQLLQSSPPLHVPSPQQFWTEHADQFDHVLHWQVLRQSRSRLSCPPHDPQERVSRSVSPGEQYDDVGTQEPLQN